MPASESPARQISPEAENMQPRSPPSGSGSEPESSSQQAAGTTDRPKATKRRAARACESCRRRKVRCDVVTQSPCTNCLYEKVECLVPECRRKRKHHSRVSESLGSSVGSGTEASLLRAKCLGSAAPMSFAQNGQNLDFTYTGNPLLRQELFSQAGSEAIRNQQYLHLSYQNGAAGFGTNAPLRPRVTPSLLYQNTGFPPLQPAIEVTQQLKSVLEAQIPPIAPEQQLPAFIKPIPKAVSPEDLDYLRAKKALTLPHPQLQNALLKAYVEYVHPYMPVMDVHPFLDAINDQTGQSGKISLLLYQAVMFVATAFVDEALLKADGYQDRREARKAFFSKTRVLYDCDTELDRLHLVQALLMMTYWYESPDDQKDTWHWMGVAISLAQTIGVHRNPVATNFPPAKRGLWKRIWWSCYMRDRMIALGMRRPTRIKDDDFDVPMLEEGDFEISVLREDNQLLGPDCALARDLDMQRELALMCIEMAKLCLLVSEMLRAQYSILSRGGMRPDVTTASTMMLLPKKDQNPDGFAMTQQVDAMLTQWALGLPSCCHRQSVPMTPIEEGRRPVVLQRHLLHLIYYTTVSALHRPQFLRPQRAEPVVPTKAQQYSQERVRDASREVIKMVTELRQHGLERCLPTTGVTVLLPAMIIQLLDSTALDADDQTRAQAAQGFKELLAVMRNLKEIYAAAAYAVNFMTCVLQGRASQQTVQRPASYQPVSTSGMNMMPPMPERPSTPPPDDSQFVNPAMQGVNNLYSGQHQASGFAANGMATGEMEDTMMMMGGQTPPGTDYDSGTPGADQAHGMDSSEGTLKQHFGAQQVTANGAGNEVVYSEWLEEYPGDIGGPDGEFLGMGMDMGGSGLGVVGEEANARYEWNSMSMGG
ncbi:fungal-specific transcription factor domain-containing protein [Triangularia verruculosa]|uniref:Fungal-specific transcription factor domain-containing protein n=1 Tax=Triangularia verruculosa TaxID=2587418 RepID=A0AAN6XSM2_9PEZI|nr:fungal-specific transcription factor domain-containing protein [Triangularia verruculosa]